MNTGTVMLALVVWLSGVGSTMAGPWEVCTVFTFRSPLTDEQRVQACTTVLESDSGRSDAEKAEALHFRSIANYKMEAFERSIADLRRAVQLDPTDSGTEWSLGHTLLRIGQAAEALPHLNAALIKLSHEEMPEDEYRMNEGSYQITKACALLELHEDSLAYSAIVHVTEIEGPSWVSALQRMLAHQGYLDGEPDGDFGPMSRDALRRCIAEQCLRDDRGLCTLEFY